MSDEFDHEADAWDQAIQLQADGQPLNEDGWNGRSCKYCNKRGLRWVDTIHGWRLCEQELENGFNVRHGCGLFSRSIIPHEEVRGFCRKLPPTECSGKFVGFPTIYRGEFVKQQVHIIFKTGPEWNILQRVYADKEDADKECKKMERKRKKSKNVLDEMSQYVVETVEVQ